MFAYLVPLRNIPHEINNLKARRRIQPARRLIKKQYLWRSDELASHTDPPCLSTTNPLPNWRPNQRLSLALQSKRGNERIDSSDPFHLCN